MYRVTTIGGIGEPTAPPAPAAAVDRWLELAGLGRPEALGAGVAVGVLLGLGLGALLFRR
jgi:hypothetical protein